MNNEERKRLSEILGQAIVKMASEIEKDCNGTDDAWDNLRPKGWKKLHAKWKTVLRKTGIKRTKVGLLHRDEKAEHEEFDPRIPGTTSIIDPLTDSCRARGYQRLDIPNDIAEKILVLGMP